MGTLKKSASEKPLRPSRALASRKRPLSDGGSPVNTRDAQLENRCQKFLDVAEQLFLEHGFAGTSVNEVVRLAGGSLATLYANYGNKEELFKAIMNRRVSAVYGGIFPEMDRGKTPHKDIRNELLRFAKQLQTKMLSASSLALFRLAIHEGPKYPSVRSAFLEDGLDVFLQWLSKYFAALAKDRLNIANSDLAAEEFLTLIQGQQRMIAACGGGNLISRKQRDDHVTRVVEVFLKLYPPVALAPGP